MERWEGKVAVVTGASSGIGAAIAEQLVIAGLKVVGLARRKERVDALAQKLHGQRGQLYAVKTDISKEKDILNAFIWVKEQLGPIYILVNNAGTVLATTLIDGDLSKWKAILDTNVLGLCIATREAVKDMRSNKIDGHIIHINSIGGHKVSNVPNMNLYPASKFAVTALTETLRQELNGIGSKIRITSISPGAVKTEIFDASGMRKLVNEEYTQRIAQRPVLNPEDVADAVCYVLATQPHVQIHELTIKPVGEVF